MESDSSESEEDARRREQMAQICMSAEQVLAPKPPPAAKAAASGGGGPSGGGGDGEATVMQRLLATVVSSTLEEANGVWDRTLSEAAPPPSDLRLFAGSVTTQRHVPVNANRRRPVAQSAAGPRASPGDVPSAAGRGDDEARLVRKAERKRQKLLREAEVASSREQAAALQGSEGEEAAAAKARRKRERKEARRAQKASTRT